MYKAVKIDITEAQALKALSGKPIRISASQLGKGSNVLSLHPENAKKVERAFSKKSGLTLSLSKGELAATCSHMGGAGFWSNIWNGLKKAWKVLKDSGVATAALDAAVAPLSAVTGQPALVGAARNAIKQATGAGVKRVSKADRYAQMRAAGIYLS